MNDAPQEEHNLPFREIPIAPSAYTAASVAARMVDGLGFRYYWATEGLTSENMSYQVSQDTRTIGETLEHLMGLSEMITNAMLIRPNRRPSNTETLRWQEQRTRTLNNLKTVSDILHNAAEGDLEKYQIIFQRGDRTTEFPFWNVINGPIADALWHAGQVVMMRRAAGNPLPPGVNVFAGTRSE